jgi:hypothetical protein
MKRPGEVVSEDVSMLFPRQSFAGQKVGRFYDTARTCAGLGEFKLDSPGTSGPRERGKTLQAGAKFGFSGRFPKIIDAIYGLIENFDQTFAGGEYARSGSRQTRHGTS